MSKNPKTEIHAIAVGPEEARQRLDRLLSQKVEGHSRMRIKALIEAGKVQVRLGDDDRTVTEPSYRVKSGELINLQVPPPVDATPLPQSMNLDIVYEDEHLIVVDKPAGLVVHPAPGNPDRTLVNALLAHCGDSLSGIGGVRRPGIVHRLDKDTSGLLVAAKHDEAHLGLSILFAKHDIHRRYRALVWGLPDQVEGRVRGNIGRNPKNRKKMAVVFSGGKHAVTHYKLIQTFGSIAALVDCHLETGRTHQIRVHLNALGHPIIGDPLYGRNRRSQLNGLQEGLRRAVTNFRGQALHAAELGFRHPIKGQHLKFCSDPPYKVQELLQNFNKFLGV